MFICLCEATIHYDTGQHLQNCVGVKINKGLYQMSTICICPSTANSKFLSSDKTHIFPLCSIVICPCTIHHKSGFPTRQPLILTFSFIFFGLNPSWRLNCVNFSDHNMSHLVCRPSVRIRFTFSTSSPEPLGRFQPNLAVVKIKEHSLSKGR